MAPGPRMPILNAARGVGRPVGDFDIAWADVEAAERRIRPHVDTTPVVQAPMAEGLWLKLESLQRTGSFKLRGAVNAVEAAPSKRLARGVSTVSAGNHGLGVAWAARRRGVPARVYVPETAVARKVDAMRAAGAEVIPRPVEDLRRHLADQDGGDGRYFIGPFAHRDVAAGQATVGAEIADQVHGAMTVLVPIGGGGLALGVGTAIRHLRPTAQVYGVVARDSPAVSRAWETGRADPVKPASIADGLGAPLADLDVVAQLKKRLAGLITVDDRQIRDAMRRLALEAKVLSEPAGAAATAAALAHPELPGPVVAVVSGGNVDPRLLSDVVA